MLALIAALLFILSPFINHVGPWPMITLGLVLLALHLVRPLVIPWRRRV